MTNIKQCQNKGSIWLSLIHTLEKKIHHLVGDQMKNKYVENACLAVYVLIFVYTNVMYY